jgi:predicted nicotinamide N-methyase
MNHSLLLFLLHFREVHTGFEVFRRGMEYEEEEWIEMKEEDGDEGFGGIFANPDPFETFCHTFMIPRESGEQEDIEISLVGRRADEAQLLSSTGLTLWRAAPILCSYLIANSESLVKGRNILELGAGMGLSGVVAAVLGASCVFLSDGDSDSLSNMRKNIQRNNSLIPTSTNIQCLQLKWGQRIAEFKAKCNLPTPSGLFDLVMGSDIIYVETILEPLFQTVDALLSPSGSFVLAYARRNVKIDLVFQTAEKFGFQWTEPTSSEGCFVFQRRERSESRTPHDPSLLR